jgi:hypothetical protein
VSDAGREVRELLSTSIGAAPMCSFNVKFLDAEVRGLGVLEVEAPCQLTQVVSELGAQPLESPEDMRDGSQESEGHRQGLISQFHRCTLRSIKPASVDPTHTTCSKTLADSRLLLRNSNCF